jgi:hypothetical protein
MYVMFYVRSAHVPLAPKPFSPCMPLVCRHHITGPPASRLAPLLPRIACPPFDSAARVGLQPATELRHLQRHVHELHVLRALRACPWPPSLLRVAPRACRLSCRHHTTGPPASRLAPLPPASHALPSTRQLASAFNQPLSFDTSSVTTMYGMFQVRPARVPLAPSLLRVGPHACRRCRLVPSLPPPGTHLAPITRPPFDSRSTRTPSTSR